MKDRDRDKEQLMNKTIKSEELYRLIAENTSDVISLTTFNLHPVFTHVSPSVKVSTGYEPEELLGKSPFEFIHPDDKNKLFPILKNYVNAKIKKFLTGKELPTTKRIEFRFKDKEGNWRDFQSTGNIVGNKLLFINRDITESKLIEEKLNKSEEQYRTMIEHSNDFIWALDKQGNFTYFNKIAEKISGYKIKDFAGKSFTPILHPEELSKVKEIFLKTLSGKSQHYEVKCFKKNRSIFILSVNTTPIFKSGEIVGTVSFGRDITKRKKAEEALNKSQQEFASLFKSNPEALVYLDKKGIILDANLRFCKLFGYTLEEVKGRNLDDGMIHPSDKIKEGKRLTSNGLKGYLNYETIRKKKDGSLFPVSISATPLVIDGQAKGEIGIYIDINERKQNETMQKVLYNISQAANSSVSLKQLYKAIHKELSSIIDTTNFYIALVDEKKDKIYFPYCVDEKDDNFPILNFSTSNTLTTYVIKTGKPLLNDNTQYEEMISQGILSSRGSTTPQSIWLGVPLKIEDKAIGAMVAQSYTNPNLYFKSDIKLLEFVSSQVATAIERKISEEKIKHLSFHDSLTGLYNRAYFEEELERYNFPRYYPLSVVMIDVNGLKVINDTFGHQEGDRLLQHLSHTLTSVSRQGDILARIGGDEFAILLPSTTSEEVHSFCERIKKVCQQDKIEPIYLRLNISLGHATQEGEYKDINYLFKVADRNMYQDKLFSGKSREKHFLEAFRSILAERDPHTSDHAQRLQKLALFLGERVGLTEYQLGNLKLLALLHDMGKIGIPDSILFKTYILTPSEWEKMREHSRIGYRMAKNIPDFAPIAQEILYHHEHWDGTGYPDGLKGEKIPLLSRIISIVDAYDVMQSRRPYKGPISKTKALKEIKKCAGTQFDPQLVEIFSKIVKNNLSREKK